MPSSHVLKQTDAGGYNRGARAHSGWNQARGDHVLLLKAIGVTLLALGGFGMVHRIIYIARLVRSVPRLFWIILLLLFQIFEVAILWPSSAVVGGAGGAGPRDAGTGKVQTLHSQLPLPSIEALNQKWTSSGLHNLPNLNECTGSCQCDKDRSEGRSAVAWTVNQIEHGAGAATRALLPWHPDGAGAVVQCVFGDRIVKGQLIPAASGDVAQQQVSCVAPPRYHLVQPGESLYAIAQSHGLSHTMLLHRNPDIVNESHIVAGQVLALTDADTVTVQASRHALRLAYWTASAASLHPLSAPPAGGGSITITGNFNLPAAFACHVVCLFGSARGRILSVTSTSVTCAVPPISLIDLDANPHSTKSVVAIVPVSLLGSDGHAAATAGLYFAYARSEICVPLPLAPRTPPRITFVAVPRPFDSSVAAAQKIAIDSWLALVVPCEVLMFADDAAAASWAAERSRVRLLPVADKTNEFGTPLLSSIFIAAAAAATGDVIVFINCDIVVNASFVTGVFAAYSSHPRVLAIGRRTNVDRGGSASVYTRWAIDYFAYSRAAFPVAIPRFAIGRAVYDNWLVGHAVKSGLAVVDLSPVVAVRHAFHSYDHVVGAGAELVETADGLGGQERVKNLELDPERTWLMGSTDHAPYVAVSCL